jgi:5-methyltetrahydropteroyltriglutamate--homocysteine methyltransferase
LRLHVCWGDGALPLIHAIPMRDILGIVLDAHSAAIAFEATNPRHEHE